MKEGKFYQTYSAPGWDGKEYSAVHKCIGVNDKGAVLVMLMNNNVDDPRPFVVDRSAWHHYIEIA